MLRHSPRIRRGRHRDLDNKPTVADGASKGEHTSVLTELTSLTAALSCKPRMTRMGGQRVVPAYRGFQIVQSVAAIPRRVAGIAACAFAKKKLCSRFALPFFLLEF